MSNELFNYTVDSPFGESIQYLTVVSESESGKEQRYQKWQKPRRTFRVSLRARNLSETNDLWRFYTRHKGSFDSFLFVNPNENPVTAEVVGSGDGVKSVFYFGGSLDIGTGDCIVTSGSEAVQRSVGGTGDYLSFTDYSIDYPVGQITANTSLPSGDVLRANYESRTRVRFREDFLSKEAFAANLWDVGLELIEVV